MLREQKEQFGRDCEKKRKQFWRDWDNQRAVRKRLREETKKSFVRCWANKKRSSGEVGIIKRIIR